MKKDNFEDLFKDSFEDFEADVNPSVWKNVQTAMKGVGLGLIGKMLLNKLGSSAVISIVSSAAAVIATVFVMNGTKTETKKPETKQTVVPNVIAEKPTVEEIKSFLTPINPSENEAKEAAAEAKRKADEAANSSANASVNKAKNNSNSVPAIKKDKIEDLLSDNEIASISSSCVGGAVPLIVNLSNIGTGKTNKWSFNDGSKAVTGANPVKFFDEPGIYTITLTSTSADGKTAVDSIQVEAFANSSLAPTQAEFSPNGDGVNDYFALKSKNIVNMSATIYDKNGNVVYQYEGIDGKWDGKKSNGQLAKDGIYLYSISADGADGKKYKQQGKIKLTR